MGPKEKDKESISSLEHRLCYIKLLFLMGTIIVLKFENDGWANHLFQNIYEKSIKGHLGGTNFSRIFWI